MEKNVKCYVCNDKGYIIQLKEMENGKIGRCFYKCDCEASKDVYNLINIRHILSEEEISKIEKNNRFPM